MQGANFDAAVVAGLFAAIIFGAKFSPELILLFWLSSGALLGAVAGLKNRKQTSNINAVIYVALVWFWSVGTAGTVAAFIAPKIGATQQSLIFVSAAACAYIGEGWLDMLRAVVRRAVAMIDKAGPKGVDQ